MPLLLCRNDAIRRPSEVRRPCGAIEIEAQANPNDSIFCHCQNCRELRDVEVSDVVVWNFEDLTFRTGEHELKTEKGKGEASHMEKHSCPSCGMGVYNSNRFGSVGVSRELIKNANGGKVPEKLQPTAHIFYDDRVKDDLPKFKDIWEEDGGSGVMLDNFGNVVAPESESDAQR
jgi:hypothetical protein